MWIEAEGNGLQGAQKQLRIQNVVRRDWIVDQVLDVFIYLS